MFSMSRLEKCSGLAFGKRCIYRKASQLTICLFFDVVQFCFVLFCFFLERTRYFCNKKTKLATLGDELEMCLPLKRYTTVLLSSEPAASSCNRTPLPNHENVDAT